MSTVINLESLTWKKMVCPECSHAASVHEDDCERLAREGMECPNCGRFTSMVYSHDAVEKTLLPARAIGSKTRITATDPTAVAIRIDESDSDKSMSRWRHRIKEWIQENRRLLAGASISLALHAALLLVLALIVITIHSFRDPFFTTITTADEDEQLILEDIAFELDSTEQDDAKPVDDAPVKPDPQAVDVIELVGATPSDLFDRLAVPTSQDQASRKSSGTQNAHIAVDSPFASRSKAARSRLVAALGGNAESEQAVDMGLKWLARHQQDNGSWSFDHRRPQCLRICTRPGAARTCQTGATGLALLCFLGAGHTHRGGDYQRHVQAGLDYLLEHEDGDLRWPKFLRVHNQSAAMYSQGLATIALCEAYGMTGDEALREPSQKAVHFIAQAQDANGGGWRYRPRYPGDTSISGWQVMALTSAEMAKLDVPYKTKPRAMKFFDSVQSLNGAAYGYRNRSGAISTTAMATLCRMYLGWKRDHPDLQKSVAYLGRTKPARYDIYSNYYTTQVLHHWGGPSWTRWNKVMRDRLVKAQIKTGHGTGSWSPQRDRWGSQGGRLYMSCLAIMTLEVYYRHLPLYQPIAVALKE